MSLFAYIAGTFIIAFATGSFFYAIDVAIEKEEERNIYTLVLMVFSLINLLGLVAGNICFSGAVGSALQGWERAVFGIGSSLFAMVIGVLIGRLACAIRRAGKKRKAATTKPQPDNDIPDTEQRDAKAECFAVLVKHLRSTRVYGSEETERLLNEAADAIEKLCADLDTYLNRAELEAMLNERLSSLYNEYGEYDAYAKGFAEAVDKVEGHPSAGTQ